MGHIFQLGRKYAEALDLKVLDEHGGGPSSWGPYGVGVSRAVATHRRGQTMMTSVWSGPATSVRQTSTSWPRAGSSPRPRGLRDG